jgi:4-hydroxy-3-polyprenylbenzoate decarboxylase
MVYDLREFIKTVEEMGECKRVENAEVDVEIGSITEVVQARPNPPMLLFDSIKGYSKGYRVVTGAVATPNRIALALGPDAAQQKLVDYFRNRLRKGVNPIAPVEVETGPIKENVHVGKDVNLLSFPAPKWHSLDGGRYIGTGDVVITRDPDEGWVNLGTFRVQVHDKTTATIYISPGKQSNIIRKKYWEKGEACPAVVVCGQDPVLFFAAALQSTWGNSEYDYAGWLRNKPVEVTKGVTTDLPIPAAAEIALEGEIVPPEVEIRTEGPFGEWTGYYASGAKPESAFRIKAILHRNDPIIFGIPPIMKFSSSYSVIVAERLAVLWNELDRIVPGIKGVGAVEEGRGLYMPAISIKQMYPGHAKQTGLAAVSSRILGYHYGRFVIVVDDDIDPSSTSDVLWAIATRCDPLTSVDIVRGCWSSGLDPTIPPTKRKLGDLTNNRAVINACKPYHWKEKFPASFKLTPEEENIIKEKWHWLFE